MTITIEAELPELIHWNYVHDKIVARINQLGELMRAPAEDAATKDDTLPARIKRLEKIKKKVEKTITGLSNLSKKKITFQGAPYEGTVSFLFDGSDQQHNKYLLKTGNPDTGDASEYFMINACAASKVLLEQGVRTGIAQVVYAGYNKQLDNFAIVTKKEDARTIDNLLEEKGPQQPSSALSLFVKIFGSLLKHHRCEIIQFDPTTDNILDNGVLLDHDFARKREEQLSFFVCGEMRIPDMIVPGIKTKYDLGDGCPIPKKQGPPEILRETPAERKSLLARPSHDNYIAGTSFYKLIFGHDYQWPDLFSPPEQLEFPVSPPPALKRLFENLLPCSTGNRYADINLVLQEIETELAVTPSSVVPKGVSDTQFLIGEEILLVDEEGINNRVNAILAAIANNNKLKKYDTLHEAYKNLNRALRVYGSLMYASPFAEKAMKNHVSIDEYDAFISAAEDILDINSDEFLSSQLITMRYLRLKTQFTSLYDLVKKSPLPKKEDILPPRADAQQTPTEGGGAVDKKRQALTEICGAADSLSPAFAEAAEAYGKFSKDAASSGYMNEDKIKGLLKPFLNEKGEFWPIFFSIFGNAKLEVISDPDYFSFIISNYIAGLQRTKTEAEMCIEYLGLRDEAKKYEDNGNLKEGNTDVSSLDDIKTKADELYKRINAHNTGYPAPKTDEGVTLPNNAAWLLEYVGAVNTLCRDIKTRQDNAARIREEQDAARIREEQEQRAASLLEVDAKIENL